jgi:hypothetical protein
MLKLVRAIPLLFGIGHISQLLNRIEHPAVRQIENHLVGTQLVDHIKHVIRGVIGLPYKPFMTLMLPDNGYRQNQ